MNLFSATIVDIPVEERSAPRLPVSLPAIVQIGQLQLSARIENISCGGAALEMETPIVKGTRILLSCGTIRHDAIVAWSYSGQFGVTFKLPLTNAEVREQVARSNALAARRAKSSSSPASPPA